MTGDAQAILRSRMELVEGTTVAGRRTVEGGCGVIGVIASKPLPGRLVIRSCCQMQNRGNSKGGGIAAVGLFGERCNDYAIHIAYLDEGVRSEVESHFLVNRFDISHSERQPSLDDHREAGLAVKPPVVIRYFARPLSVALEEFAARTGIEDEGAARDEFVYQGSFCLNREYYAAGDAPPRAFVLSHGRDLMILKGVGYAEQIARYYRLEHVTAHVWIGHQRYPTRGRVWHPGGAHPFVGLHEALVHNGDFANYHAVTEYLRQRGIVPLFVTDTEVAVLLFDLYARVFSYPLEFVIEALAPTPEGDFERLSKRRQRIYRAIQTAHLHGSPDGPWFFIVVRAEPGTGDPQLIGITDVSMLRPQVFAFQNGKDSYGAIASEKQAIDAFFEELHVLDPDVPPMADHYWNARGGSATDGGAFVYTLRRTNASAALEVRDKFGSPVAPGIEGRRRPRGAGETSVAETAAAQALLTSRRADTGRDGREGPTLSTPARLEAVSSHDQTTVALLRSDLLRGDLAGFHAAVQKISGLVGPQGWSIVLNALTLLRDRRWDPGTQRRSVLLSAIDCAIVDVLDALPGPAGRDDCRALRFEARNAWLATLPAPRRAEETFVVDAKGFCPEGPHSVARLLVAAHLRGWSRLIVYRCTGDRFLGCGLGPTATDVRIDIYGSSGDYLGSGLDGPQIYVHGDAQDQVGQILKSGRIVVFGSVGQTLLYGAKGGEAYVMGSTAGRPLINAVGCIRTVINGSCLDYCAESFMAGDQMGGGFVIINGLTFNERGEVLGLGLKYPGNNLFSLASGGACYLNDPYSTVGESQLNGASFVPFRHADWNIILPYLKRNEELFGISIRHDLLMVDGVLMWPKEVFRKVTASVETEKLDWSSLTP